MESERKSLFDRIGGMVAVEAAVNIFYSRVIADAGISHFFQKIDMETQSGKMKAFLAYAFGAPLNYSGKNMREAHAHMKLTEHHFNSVAGHLVATLQQLMVGEQLIEEVLAIALSTKKDVLGL